MDINEKLIGRRFTIEPKPASEPSGRHKHIDAIADQHVSPQKKQLSSDAISGIRLFPGNQLIASRKFGCFRNQLVMALARQDLKFTVTEHGVDPELFARVLYHCPRGIFVQTVRNDEEVPPPKGVTDRHREYTFDRDVGQTVVIRPRGEGRDAVDDLETYGVFLISWFDEALGRVRLRVAATEAWEVWAGELAPERKAVLPPPKQIREDSREFLQAFFQESAAYLDAEELDLLKEKARERLLQGQG